jgi:hypothetical protein
MKMHACMVIGAIAAVAGANQATPANDKAGKREAKPARGATPVEILKDAQAEAGNRSLVEGPQKSEPILQ